MKIYAVTVLSLLMIGQAVQASALTCGQNAKVKLAEVFSDLEKAKNGSERYYLPVNSDNTISPIVIVEAKQRWSLFKRLKAGDRVFEAIRVTDKSPDPLPGGFVIVRCGKRNPQKATVWWKSTMKLRLTEKQAQDMFLVPEEEPQEEKKVEDLLFANEKMLETSAENHL